MRKSSVNELTVKERAWFNEKMKRRLVDHMHAPVLNQDELIKVGRKGRAGYMR